MNPIGRPIEIQNTDTGHWLVRCDNILDSPSEAVSFRVAIRRSEKPLGAVQREAVERAITLLNLALKNMPTTFKDQGQ